MGSPAAIPPDLPWISAGECLLHIGVYKTGTTSLQVALSTRRADLRHQGVAYPGGGVNHNNPAMAAMGIRRRWATAGTAPQTRSWDLAVAESRSQTVRTIISSETFCQADDAQAAAVVAALGRGRTKVLITLRPLEQLVPSSWQEYVKGGLDVPFDQWLTEIVRGPGITRWTPSFWKRNDFGRLVERWVSAAGPDNVAVLVVDRLRPDDLHRRFEELVGLPRDYLAPDPGRRTNRSLSAAEAEVVRALNERMRDRVPALHHRWLVRKGAANHLLKQRIPAEGEPGITLPGWAVERLRALDAGTPDRISATGARVIGDLAGLVPTSPVDPRRTGVPGDLPLDAAVLLLEGMLLEASARLGRPPDERDRPPPEEGPAGPGRRAATWLRKRARGSRRS